jgi:hypothetical protein
MLLAVSASAAVPDATLAAFGLGGMQQMTDAQGMSVRGAGIAFSCAPINLANYGGCQFAAAVAAAYHPPVCVLGTISFGAAYARAN